jgi:hypothetical protein
MCVCVCVFVSFNLLTRNYYKSYLTRELSPQRYFLRERQFTSQVKKYFAFISLEAEGIFCAYKGLTGFSISTQTSPILTLMLYLFKLYFNIILASLSSSFLQISAV